MTNYSGYTTAMESFTINTDINARGTVGLSGTPVADGAVILCCNGTAAARYAEFISRSGTAVVIQIRKLRFDKPYTTESGVNNLPGGVSSTSSKFNTDTVDSASGAPGGGPAAVNGHNHGVSYQYGHSHTISTFATTTCPLATSESNIGVLCVYAKT